MRENGFRIECKEMELITFLTEVSTEVVGRITSLVDKEFMNFQTELSMRVNGKTI
jgi:hypothetical protein